MTDRPEKLDLRIERGALRLTMSGCKLSGTGHVGHC
jgi:hypothetical protein